MTKLRFLFDQAVPMRDGARLSADVYLPPGGGPWPALVMRTPYDNATERHLRFVTYLATRGFAFVFQDVRGRGDSEGRFEPFVHEGRDGYDTIEWAAAQPWCDGKVGTLGASYMATAQWLAAKERPPHLVTMVSAAAAGRWLRELPFMNGKINLGSLLWLHGVAGRTNQPALEQGPLAATIDWRALLAHLPTLTADEVLGRRDTVWRDWISDPTWARYRDRLSLEGHFEQLDLPVLHLTGWYDADQPGALHYYEGMVTRSRAPEHQHLVCGPWFHAGVWYPERHAGGQDFTDRAVLDIERLHLRWFERWLKGVRDGRDEEPRARLFLMGRNEWRDASAWPPPGARSLALYLRSGGVLADAPAPGDPPDRFVYDPRHPTPSAPGYGFSPEATSLDRRSAEQRDDVRVFTSAPLSEPLVVVGIPRVALHASTDVTDTDFAATLCDVYPDGRSVLLADGILRASFRESLTDPQPIVPNRAYAYPLELGATANVFAAGHRVRLSIQSCMFPRYDRNPNTGDPVGRERGLVAANQTILHDLDHPSCLILPVLDGEPEVPSPGSGG